VKADYIFTNPFSNKTLFFSRCKMRLVKMTLTKGETKRKLNQYRVALRRKNSAESLPPGRKLGLSLLAWG
jgi:hypothetical protein